MKKAGRVKSWHADKGYGFIDIHADLKDIFFHITALQSRAVKPKPGDRVTFELGKGKDGRMQATSVSQGQASRVHLLPATMAAAALMAIWGGALSGYLPRHAGLVSLVMSAVAFLAYAFDKNSAKRDARRTPEARLHFLALCGGWPGALAAQHLLRHKNRKQAFQLVFWGTVALNLGALVACKTYLPD
ncbi:peptidyl-tRNA hydrolase Pth [Cupriavidus basilensis OR16]|uniref:Peptidyl-tRNA hydrolase Pth n=1 Tax=Cupriavidus basilensis OR16 TaxID=1127483 RepID=H1SCB5_9BURK|nr:cold shock and DUF1294 domain-containing protein [Cupriavidus basilensis]EHP39893.1 peptidyl-tRNA hydrolase Pth [Cupriavidus basilensis OR16]